MNLFGDMQTIPLPVAILLLIWVLSWKGVALWKAARNGHMYWFAALLVMNTLGALEIAYVFFFSKPKKSDGESAVAVTEVADVETKPTETE